MDIELTPKGQTYRGIARAIRVVIAAVVVLALIVLARIVLIFFGQLKTLPGYQFIVDFSESFMGPFKAVGTVQTPYDGVFDIGATILLILLIFIEFVLSGIAGFFNRRARHEIIKEEKPETPAVQVVVSPTIGSNIAGSQTATPDAPSPSAADLTPEAITKAETAKEPKPEVETIEDK